ncbi:uncharacterized protein LOC123200437 isoform X2 [Mangifera indica]|nr:uncharacterized protein LOC123200437 isoform X2 [Mangifera indica]
MEEGENILGAIYEDDKLEDFEDVEMLDVEEGELLEHVSSKQNNLEKSHGGNANVGNPESQSKNRRRRAIKKKNKKKKSGLGPKFTDINRFVSDTCKHLKERKSYMVYTAVGCLGVSALGDFIKEVDAIQACGGQMTANGTRARTGGGILWSIIKARAPSAYKEIMKKTKEFEKQFRQQNRQAVEQTKEDSPQRADFAPTNGISPSNSDGSMIAPQHWYEQSSVEGNRKSVHQRIRVPVSYDDDLLGEDPRTESL